MLIWLTAGCARVNDDTFRQPSQIETLAMREVPADALAESQSRGRKVFEHYCAICHGGEGQGNGFNSTHLDVPPQDLTAPQFWQKTSDERLILAVSKGGPAVGKSDLMPAWGRTLNDQQLHDAVSFLHSFAPYAKPNEQ